MSHREGIQQHSVLGSSCTPLGTISTCPLCLPPSHTALDAGTEQNPSTTPFHHGHWGVAIVAVVPRLLQETRDEQLAVSDFQVGWEPGAPRCRGKAGAEGKGEKHATPPPVFPRSHVSLTHLSSGRPSSHATSWRTSHLHDPMTFPKSTGGVLALTVTGTCGKV